MQTETCELDTGWTVKGVKDSREGVKITPGNREGQGEGRGGGGGGGGVHIFERFWVNEVSIVVWCLLGQEWSHGKTLVHNSQTISQGSSSNSSGHPNISWQQTGAGRKREKEEQRMLKGQVR